MSADGATVYAAVLHGNDGATVLSQAEAGDSLPAPQPPMNPALPVAPKTALIVHLVNGHWRDAGGKLWDSRVPYSVPRVEVLRFDTANPGSPTAFGGLATSMFATDVNPVSGTCAAVGTEAMTEIRFEPNLRGHTTESRVALLPAAGPATKAPLNPHINYAVPTGPGAERDSSLAIPSGARWSPDGQRLFVLTADGSAKLGVLNTTGTMLAPRAHGERTDRRRRGWRTRACLRAGPLPPRTADALDGHAPAGRGGLAGVRPHAG